MQLSDRKLSARLKRVWTGVAVRLRLRKSGGLMKLKKDVITCEYEDVHVLWEMIRKHELEQSPRKRKKGKCNNCFEWAKKAPFLSRNF